METLHWLLWIVSCFSAIPAIRVLSTSRLSKIFMTGLKNYNHVCIRNLETFEDGSGACLKDQYQPRSLLQDFTVCLRSACFHFLGFYLDPP